MSRPAGPVVGTPESSGVGEATPSGAAASSGVGNAASSGVGTAASSGPVATRRRSRRSLDRVADAARRARRAWRQSLRLRVVATTMLLGLVVVSLLGGVLFQQIGAGLERDRVRSAQREALALTAQAQGVWDSTTANSVDGLDGVAGDIVKRDLAAPGRFVVMSRSAGNESDIVLSEISSGEVVDASVVSPELRERVASAPGRQQTQLREVPVDGMPVPSVVVGSVMEVPLAGSYDLYVIYPMDREVATMELIRTSFVLAGVILTLLVGAVAWVVTRQVVSPVRRAAEVAQRLQAGRLNERMPSRGEDDLAQLATSFNDMADSLQHQIRQLEGLSAVQQRFVSDVSHELRTPLTTIRMAADLIHQAREDFDPAVARSAELLTGELDRFEALLSDLLEISRFDAGAAALDLEPVDLRSVVVRVVESVRPLADRRGSTITVHAPEGPADAEVDQRRVERVLRNLVVNAVEHGEGHPIDVHVAVDPGAVALVVEDHGVGLRPGDAAKVFTRFWRADPARARTTGGTGLGLSISLEDARLHHGWLQAWGEPGVGSRFRLTLPRRSGQTLDGSPLPLDPAERP
ncbi:MAG: MtrAB system histidine kinase MtrB [Dermatophilaceae bacterium]